MVQSICLYLLHHPEYQWTNHSYSSGPSSSTNAFNFVLHSSSFSLVEELQQAKLEHSLNSIPSVLPFQVLLQTNNPLVDNTAGADGLRFGCIAAASIHLPPSPPPCKLRPLLQWTVSPSTVISLWSTKHSSCPIRPASQSGWCTPVYVVIVSSSQQLETPKNAS